MQWFRSSSCGALVFASPIRLCVLAKLSSFVLWRRALLENIGPGSRTSKTMEVGYLLCKLFHNGYRTIIKEYFWFFLTFYETGFTHKRNKEIYPPLKFNNCNRQIPKSIITGLVLNSKHDFKAHVNNKTNKYSKPIGVHQAIVSLTIYKTLD